MAVSFLSIVGREISVTSAIP